MTPKPSETGAALLAVLLLVAVMASLSAVALEKMTLAARTASNAAALEQARAFALGAESYAVLRVGDLTRMTPDRTTLRGGWHGSPIRIPLPGGFASAIAVDGGNCFNLNSVVQKANPYAGGDGPLVYASSSRGMGQLAGLLRTLGTASNEAEHIAQSLGDWIDTDTTPNPGGGEDNAYANLPVPYRTANGLMIDPSELRAVAGVTPAAYAAVAPWLCALPQAVPSPINVNTLQLDQAPLLAMLLPGQLTLDSARALIARRPPDGWPTIDAFWSEPIVKPLNVAAEIKAQTVMKTRWFRLALDVELTGAQMSEVALIDAGSMPARLVSRTWGQD